MKRPALITNSHASTFLPSKLIKQLNLNDFELSLKSDPATAEIFAARNATQIVHKFSRIIGDPNGNPRIFTPNKNGAASLWPQDGKKVFVKNPSPTEVAKWRAQFVTPYFRKIETELPRMKFLIDGHSHFSRDQRTGTKRSDIVISNRNFETCGAELTQQIVKFFIRNNFSVSVNEPFRGGFLLAKFCGKKNPPGIQLEIKRSLYLDEKTLKVRSRDVAKLRGTIEELVEFLSQKI